MAPPPANAASPAAVPKRSTASLPVRPVRHPMQPAQILRDQRGSTPPPATPVPRSVFTGPPPGPSRQQAVPDLALLAGFTRQVQTAVQASAIYPPVARRMLVQGRVQVRFDYSGGAVSSIAVAVPSVSPMLDRAALAAVRNATYPQAPTTLERTRLPLLVWVDFHLQTDG